jgi:simple sugar transport system substrate-binding protein
MRRLGMLLALILVATLALTACQASPSEGDGDDELVFGLVLVGPKNDHGWSEAHYTAGQYVEGKVPGARMIYLESLNSADRPETTLEQVVSEMVDQGAELIFTTSDAFEEDTTRVAAEFPDVTFINVSGDDVRTGEAPENLGNLMGQMYPMKAVAGAAAALKTETGSIAYLGPLINHETLRLASAAYLGARYAYEHYRGLDPDDLTFTVNWIGYWFNIPGVTLDPTEVTNQFFDAGADVVISGIDTTEAMVVAGQRAEAGETVWAVPYDYEGACAQAPEICLGVPYFHWGPAYVEIVESVMDGTWEPSWDWNPPDWDDLNNPDTTAVGFLYGDGLAEDEKATLDEFIAGLGDGSIELWAGPLNYQDGSAFLADGEVAAPEQIWYLEQLLEGMVGTSR